jgi:hypothetical protein
MDLIISFSLEAIEEEKGIESVRIRIENIRSGKKIKKDFWCKFEEFFDVLFL